MSRRTLLMLVTGLTVTGAVTWFANRTIAEQERDSVRLQAENVAGAVTGVGDPIVATIVEANAHAIREPDGAGFSESLDPVIARSPMVRSVNLLDTSGPRVRTIAAAGLEPTAISELGDEALTGAGSGVGAIQAFTNDPQVIVFMSAFPAVGIDDRAIYVEFIVDRDWLDLLANDVARDIHLSYQLVAPGASEPTLVYETGGEPQGPSYSSGVFLGASELRVVASATPDTLGAAEKVLPMLTALVGLLLTALGVSVSIAMDRRAAEVARLNLETLRLDAALAEQLRVERELAHRAYHDALTGLPNRAWLIEHLHTSDGDRPTAVFFLDLDGFKVVNDSLGHEVGDELLVRIAKRLAEALPRQTITRFGGDEFVIVSHEPFDEALADDVSNRIRTAVSPALGTESGDVFVTASIGVRPIEPGDNDPEELLRDADAAMYAAKETGRDRHVVFHPLVRDRALERLRLDSGLRRALDDDQFQIEYQPVVNLDDGQMRGVEALVRWHHPDRGLMLPDAFMPILAETGLATQLDELVISNAVAQLRRWLEDGLALTLAVNVTAASIDREDFAEFIHSVVAEHEIPPDRLVIELTEQRSVDRADRSWIERIQAEGVRVGIDDFGTGYSSIAYLRDLPIDFLKLDASFVSGLGEDVRTGAIVKSLLGLTAELGIITVAEGVETARQAEVLQAFGCLMGQGTWFSPPLDPEELARSSRVVRS